MGRRINIKPDDIPEPGHEVGVVESLKWRIRCGARPCARQMRCTEETLIPTILATAADVQCFASCGGSVAVRATTLSITSWPSGAMREGRVLSRRRPSTPSSAKRSCQRHTQVFDFYVRRMISTVPQPSADRSTISARQTCFCGALRLRMIA
jgi:hypothetical protein